MGIRLDNNGGYRDLAFHVGHKILVSEYGNCNAPANIAEEGGVYDTSAPTCGDCGHLEREHDDFDVDGNYVDTRDPDWSTKAVTRHVCPVECEDEECPMFRDM